MAQYFVGIDIGSTASKTVVMDKDGVVDALIIPTGWNGRETAETILEKLKEKSFDRDMVCVATGYGRICVDYAEKIVTEITCHGRGGWHLFHEQEKAQDVFTIVDVGGQDTKLITVEKAQVTDFLMNDKCAAGTGKFMEIMSTRLGASLEELYQMAQKGTPLSISAMCTVFAESEVISHIGSGKKREDIAAGVIDSVAMRVGNLCRRHGVRGKVRLTGGLCDSPYFVKILSQKIGCEVGTHPMARYAGALGAALIASGQI